MASGSKTEEKKSSSPLLPADIPYAFLKKATNDFSADREIAGSPFGTLYKGIVPDGQVIAIKKLQENAPIPAEKTFKKEVHKVMMLRHENIVQIVGYCCETSKKLVQFDKRYIQADMTEYLICYEYLPNGSLEEYLFGKEAAQHINDWDTRFKIIKGICQGLRFLHTSDIPIIHMDLKPENIWLDANLVPKISNFALSRILGQEQTRLCTQTVVGSYGYMAPEYVYRGEISAQSDIYSLGLMILEITTGKKNYPEDKKPSARKYIDKIREDWTAEHIALKYSSYESESLQQIQACIHYGLKCAEIDRRTRPSIQEIVVMFNAQPKRKTGYENQGARMR